MNEFLYLVAIAIVLTGLISFLKIILKKLSSVHLKIDFENEKRNKQLNSPTSKLQP